MVITTLLVVGVQFPKLIVHRKVYTPGIKPVTEVVGELGVVMTGVFGPVTIVHNPVPITGVLPERFVLVARHNDWGGPADDAVGPDIIVMVPSEKLTQAPLVIVQRNT